ncbi:hypothetical protein FDP41_005329 [Naegleria fowleri]|uniref:Alanine--tRNA ligase n=1 Tax=Naegleria fowleri TaxID=5763 RepID=A0A6A5BP67_NAEFO|nr:uncharacterized protein FDP41_005329 [Naegleria fowleri]KAF0975335.1 hypothetical protein FDP41_005329 [Naegleria fowleri]
MSNTHYINPATGKEWTSKEIRKKFVEFFEKKYEHTFVPSNSVIPHEDPTLLFTNAGMNQFKAIFLGQVNPESSLAKLKRAVNSQKCIRAGGKHNDLDDVGKDTYHHTFFEMLGNWSFGDYFKKEAIAWAWELLTDVYGLEKDRLYVTYFGGNDKLGLQPDTEAKELWKQFVPESHILPGSMKDNFWEMGDTGPCGPCSEIHYDRIGGRDAAHLVNMDDPNVIEIWNNVFMEFNRKPDQSLEYLPAKHVDTGMGLERLVSILQNKMSNYDTDVFMPIFDAIQKETGARSYTGKLGKEDVDHIDTAYRVIADHIRTLVIALSDGGYPDSTGRGYVLRRIVRRAVRFGEFLNAKKGFLSRLAHVVVENMGDFFPELRKNPGKVEQLIQTEEDSFAKTLRVGLKFFEKITEKMKQEGKNVVSGTDAFKLYATYGFPVDLTLIMAQEQNMTVDMMGYNEEMEKHRLLSEGAKQEANELKLGVVETAKLQNELKVEPTQDELKYVWENITAKIVAIYSKDSGFINKLDSECDEVNVGIVLDRTNFYAEGGGQAADIGSLVLGDSILNVADVQKFAGFILHIANVSESKLSNNITVGAEVSCQVDFERRKPIAANHTTTHMLNFALRKVFGKDCDQQGSVVKPEELTFDYSYSHPKAPTDEQYKQIETIVNTLISENHPVYSKVHHRDTAYEISGLRAMFGAAYGEQVRVVSIGEDVDEIIKDRTNEKWHTISVEFCGGTHLTQTSQAQEFVIVADKSIAAGKRRIIGLTRDAAKQAKQIAKQFSEKIDELEKLPDETYCARYYELNSELDKLTGAPLLEKRNLEKRLGEAYLKVRKIQQSQKKDDLEKANQIIKSLKETIEQKSLKYLVYQLEDGSDQKFVKKVCDALTTIPVLLISKADDKNVIVMAYVPDQFTQKLGANTWVQETCKVVNGKGGGKPSFAQGRGADLSKVADAVKLGEEMAAKFN